MAKVLPFEIPIKATESIHVQKDDVPYFYDILHKHPEVQITYIVRGRGMVFCGDYIGQFKENELYVMGANQPHLFKCNEDYYSGELENAEMMSFYFGEQSLGPQFFGLPELTGIKRFLNRTEQGLMLGGIEARKFKAGFFTLYHQEGIERIKTFLEILTICSDHKDFSPLAKQANQPILSENEGERMNKVIHFTIAEYYRPIGLDEVADIANMTKQAFCRFFKKRTRKTYVNFLNETRISKAASFLENNDHSISEVADLCGYNNLSNFNRMFKKVMGRTPTEYRKLKKNVST